MDKDIRVIQQKSLYVLMELIGLFEKYQLTYYLSGGTFLGAVRHKGFIPWDDDIDISMPRKDYDLFVNNIYKELPEYIKIQNFKTDSTYKYFITRVLDTEMYVEEIRTKTLTHPAVDILPLDGSPNKKIFREMYFIKIMIIRYLISISNKDIIDIRRNRGTVEKIVIWLVKKTPDLKFLNDYKLKLYLEKNMKKYEMNESQYSGCLMGAYRTKQMVPTKWFGKGKKYLFEGSYLNGPDRHDEYLKQMYGDYSRVPDAEEILSKVHYKILEKQPNQ